MSKKVDTNDLFRCSDGEMPEQLPLLTSEERNRIYKMSERKYNKDSEDIPMCGDSVSGVERYSRPVWKRRLASVAAAGVLLAGSGGLAYYVRNGSFDGFSDSAAVDMLSPSSEQDYEEIAAYLLDGYTDFRSRMEAPESIKSTIVTLHIEGVDTEIARYADKNINSMADFRALGAKYMTGEYLDDNFDFSEAPDRSEWDEDDSISAYQWWAEDANTLFFMYNGELYTYYHEDTHHWCYKGKDISDSDEDSFVVRTTLETDLNGDTVLCPMIFQIERNDEGEWRIASTKIDDEKVQTQPFEPELDVIETAKSYSDRYVQLQDYIYTRPCSEDESVTFTLQLGENKGERRYYKIEDDYTNTENAFWNAHTIEEIRYISRMDFSLFSQLYGNGAFGKVDDTANEGDLVSFEDNDPVFIEYKGAMYTHWTNEDREMMYQYHADSLLLPFTDEPEIVSSDPLEIVFRRKTGHRSNYAEINQIPTTYEFELWKLNDDEWHLTSVENISSESKTAPDFNSMTNLYNNLVNALMSYEYLDLDRTISYYATISGKTELQADFAPFTHPDNITPQQIDDMLEEVFTKQYREKITSPYYQALKSKPYVDKDFGEYPDGYKWENPSDEEFRNSPFVSMFIYRDGELYRNTNRTLCWLPFYPLDTQFEIHQSVEESNGKYTVVSKCTSDYQGIDSGIVPSSTRLKLTFVNEDGSWKIDEVGALEE
ncbi:MAG: hypothetical protein Q4A05_01165 [Ruminococcus sp.]|nr:hypothetical protein [Ruminococcus sp.]